MSELRTMIELFSILSYRSLVVVTGLRNNESVHSTLFFIKTTQFNVEKRIILISLTRNLRKRKQNSNFPKTLDSIADIHLFSAISPPWLSPVALTLLFAQPPRNKIFRQCLRVFVPALI